MPCSAASSTTSQPAISRWPRGVDAAAERVDRRAGDRVAAHRPADLSARCLHRTGIVTIRRPSGERRSADRAYLLPPSRPPTAFDGFVDGFADRRFGSDDAVDDFFGDFGDAGFFERAAGDGFVDRVDGAVDGFGHFRRGRAAPPVTGWTTSSTTSPGDLPPPLEPLLPPPLLLFDAGGEPPPEEAGDWLGAGVEVRGARRARAAAAGAGAAAGRSPPVRIRSPAARCCRRWCCPAARRTRLSPPPADRRRRAPRRAGGRAGRAGFTVFAAAAAGAAVAGDRRSPRRPRACSSPPPRAGDRPVLEDLGGDQHHEHDDRDRDEGDARYRAHQISAGLPDHELWKGYPS